MTREQGAVLMSREVRRGQGQLSLFILRTIDALLYGSKT